jgi:acyl-CoA synthetase (AMP-forming)/AMP-acid ligase II
MNPSRLATPDRAPAESAAPTVGDLLRAVAAHPRASTHGLRFLDRRESETFVAWREVAERAERVAGALRALGVAPGERVALIFPTGIEFFDAFFGTLLARAVPSPLYPPFRLGSMAEYDRRTAAMITASSASLLLVDRAVRRLLGGLTARLESRLEPRLGCRTLAELDASPRAHGNVGRPLVPAAEVPAAEGLAAGSAGDLALVQFSSGTTGVPKPVALTHSAILHQGRLLNSHWPDTPELEQSGVSWLPLYHDMGLIGCILPALMRPATLTLLGPELFIARPAAWLRSISRYRATISPAPNFAYALAAERVRDSELVGVDLSSWRAALNGAEAVSGPALRRFHERFARFGLRPEALTPVYGLAEAALAVTFSPLERPYRSAWFDRGRLAEADASPRTRSAREAGSAPPADLVEVVSVGVPVPGFEVEVRAARTRAARTRGAQTRGAQTRGDETAASDCRSPDAGVLPAGRVGRIFVRGPSLMNGYLDQPEESAAVLDELGWLDTGDRGFVLDGELWVTGRAKDVLVVHGRNHDPEPLERAVGAVAGVRTGCVAAVSHLPAGGEVEELVVLAELRRGSGSSEQERAAIETACRQRALAETGLRVDRLVPLEAGALPRTSSGKLRRREALDRYLRAELHAKGNRGAIARLVRRWSERPAVLAALAVARSRLARSGADEREIPEREIPGAELEER